MMKKSRFLLLCLTLFVLSGLAVYAFDFGINLENTTQMTSIENSLLYQKDVVTFWMDFYFGETSLFYFSGFYTFTLSRYYLFDFDKLYYMVQIPLAGKSNSLIELSIGRLNFSDYTGYVLNHPLDGFDFYWGLSTLQLKIFAAYSGLVFNLSSDISMTQVDYSLQNQEGTYMGPSRLIEGVEVVFPQLFGNNTLFVSFLAQQDLNPSDKLVEEGEENLQTGSGGRLHSFYLGAGLSGNFTSNIYYDIFSYLSTGLTLSYLDDSSSGTGSSYQQAWMLGYLGGAGLRLYFDQALFSLINLKFIYSSGDSDSTAYYDGNSEGLATQFVPISETALAYVFKPLLGNIFFIDFSYSFKPFSSIDSPFTQSIQTVFQALVFFRSTTAPISVSGIDADSDALYLGTEMSLVFNLRPLSDVGISLSFALFLPNNGSGGAFSADEADIQFITQLYLSFSF